MGAAATVMACAGVTPRVPPDATWAALEVPHLTAPAVLLDFEEMPSGSYFDAFLLVYPAPLSADDAEILAVQDVRGALVCCVWLHHLHQDSMAALRRQ